MSVIVTDAGFAPDGWTGGFVSLAEADDVQGVQALNLLATDDPARLSNRLADLPLIRIAFAAFNDGRGFTLARRLRMMGYQGRLRAHGPILADQYAMAPRVGSDEAEIPDELAATVLAHLAAT